MFELLTSRSAFARLSLQGLAVLSALLLSACAGLQPPPRQPSPVIAELKVRARNLAAAGQPRRALQTYQAIHALAPLEAGVVEPMRALQQNLQEQASTHREQGHRLLARGKPGQARISFLKSLACVPDRNDALAALQDLTRNQGTILSTPSTERADPRRIAQDVYQDPDKDFIVAHFLDPDRSSSPQRLKLPRLDFELKREPGLQTASKKPAQNLSIPDLKGRSPSQSEQPDASGGPGPAQDPAEAYHQAMRLKSRGDHAPALRVLSSLPPEFKDVREQMTALRRELKTRAEARYKAGLASFLADDLQQAIREWERALALDPGHRKARKGLDKARVLLKTLENY
jgi:tetratricopeptide (TPR) repeat protein